MQVYDYLAQTPAGTQSRDVLHNFIEKVEKYKLTKGERLQAMNVRPSSAVEVHLIVEDCEERMTVESVEQFLEEVKILPQPPEKPEEEVKEEDDGAEDENDDAEEGDEEEDMEE
ncbi:hypothetical protein GOP47_0006141 [Adiantum capillus-veneris]|uniref:DNA-directed RNA polymerase III subunit RPC9 n=1 Tax=Adiantum capillus-veneris TaxID=13818 RepID=A0A9D4V2W2_ADICA|nr:hypothetical protein GOP47_0006141 [Adiantum capillus-veneris]